MKNMFKVLFVTFALSLGVFGVVFACSPPLDSEVDYETVLGFLSLNTIAQMEEGDLLFPQNLAVMLRQGSAEDFENGLKNANGELVSVTSVYPNATSSKLVPHRVAQALDVEEAYTFKMTALPIGDFVDEEAPSSPFIRQTDFSVTISQPGDECSHGDHTILEALIALSEDDLTPGEYLTYGFYFGATVEEVQQKDVPDYFAIPSSFDDEGDHLILSNLPVSLYEQDVFLSISSIDFAGNESEKTQPLEVHAADTLPSPTIVRSDTTGGNSKKNGCQIGGNSSAAFWYGALGMLLVFTRRCRLFFRLNQR